MALTPEQLRFVLAATHYDWWGKEMQPRLDKAYGGKGKVPEAIQKGLFDASAAGFQAGYSMGYEARERDAQIATEGPRLRQALEEIRDHPGAAGDDLADIARVALNQGESADQPSAG